MSQNHLPAGCHDAETAAKLLHMSTRALLAKLRELGWLNTGGGQGNHNLPRRDYTKNGFLCTQDRGFCLKGKKEISKTYRVMLLTQTGFNALKSELEKVNTPTKPNTENTAAVVAHLPPPHLMHQVNEQPEAPFDHEAADKERAQTMNLLREWGIAS
jgi:hypothetical protein